MAERQVKVAIVGDKRGLKSALDKAERDMAGFSGKMKAFGSSVRSSLTTWAPVAGAALVGFGIHAINVASDVEEAGNKIDVVFGKNAEAVRAFGEDAAEAMGMSQRDYLTFAGRIGALVKPMGASEERAAEMSTTLTQLAADLGSFHNVSSEEALTALASAMSGEMEPMKRFGVVLNDASLKAKALEMGLYSGKGTLDAFAKSQAAYALILEQTNDAQGDFARTADSTANKTKILQAKFTDLTAELGEKLLPVANVALEGLIGAVDHLSEWWDGDGQQLLVDFRNGLDVLSDWWDEEGQGLFSNLTAGWSDQILGIDDANTASHDFQVGLMGIKTAMQPGIDATVMMYEGMWNLAKGAWGAAKWMMDAFKAFHDFAMGVIQSILTAIGWVVDRVMGMASALKSVASFGDALTGGRAGGLVQGILDRFDSGGVVPGAVGKPRLAIVEGGETILPTHKANFGGGQPVVINIAGHRVAEVLLPAISDQLAKDRRAHTGSRRVG